MTALLSVQHLSLAPRLHDVSLSLARGRTLGLLGVNGAGKSTLLSLLAGAVGADSGELRLDDERLHQGNAGAWQRRIGWLPQRPPLYPDMTVQENLHFAAELRLGRSPPPPLLAQQLERFGLGPLASRLAHRLSGGEAMRLGLACCLVHQPDLLLLDEPTAGLDPLQAQQLRELIRSLAGERAVLIASHLLPDIEQLCDRALLLHRGRVIADEPLHRERRLWQARFSHPPEDAALLQVPGVARVVSRDGSSLVLQLSVDASPAMPEKLACHGWGLRLWQPAPLDLAARFRALSSGEQA